MRTKLTASSWGSSDKATPVVPSYIEEAESTFRSCGVDGISRYACCVVVGKCELAEIPITEEMRRQGAVRTGVEARPAFSFRSADDAIF